MNNTKMNNIKFITRTALLLAVTGYADTWPLITLQGLLDLIIGSLVNASLPYPRGCGAVGRDNDQRYCPNNRLYAAAQRLCG